MRAKEIKNTDFLATQVKRGVLSADDLSAYNTGVKQLQSDELFIRKELSGMSGIVEVINENDVRKVAITNLSKGRVPEEKNIVIDKIGVRVGYHALSVDPAQVAYTNAIFNIADLDTDGGGVLTGDTVYARIIPIGLQNAEYDISCDDNIIDSGRIEDLLTQNVSTDSVNGADKNFKELEWPKMVLAGKRLTFNIRFAEGAVVPAGKYYVELVMKGLGLGKRAVNS